MDDDRYELWYGGSGRVRIWDRLRGEPIASYVFEDEACDALDTLNAIARREGSRDV
jgi:hypothetical protein